MGRKNSRELMAVQRLWRLAQKSRRARVAVPEELNEAVEVAQVAWGARDGSSTSLQLRAAQRACWPVGRKAERQRK